MNSFVYTKASGEEQAVQLMAAGSGAKFLGGGTNLVDLMRETLERPSSLVDVSGLSPAIEELPGGGLRIGASASNSAIAGHQVVRSEYPVLSRALLAGASGQIRNMATAAGNILQRTRCAYFYDNDGSRCNKRNPGQGCDALEGFHRNHAILGASSSCVATHPSDMCVALAALDAVLCLKSASGTRRIPLRDFHLLPGDTPQVETALHPGELITAIELPQQPVSRNSTYRKVRDRSSYAFALVSVAAALDTQNGMVKNVRLALGGVAHKPWRASKLESMLVGKPALGDHFRQAAAAELADARPLRDNTFKVDLAVRTIVAVLTELAGANA